MRTETRAPSAEAGFTLIEVVAAMVILAVGLLALEALGIGAARSITLAQRQSEYALVASDSLESALRQLREGQVPAQFCTNLRRGDRLSRTVSFPGSGNVVAVSVAAIPTTAQSTTPRDTFEITSSLFLPTLPGASANGTPCS